MRDFSTIELVFLCVLIGAVLAQCQNMQPTCQDNPRNMRCMSASELEKELSK
jgi:hypothetical protein